MAWGSNNRGKGFASLNWKTDNFGTSATMWFKESKKSGVYKYTLSFGQKTVTFLIDTVNAGRTVTNKYGQNVNVMAVKVLLGKGTNYGSDIAPKGFLG